MSTPYTKQRIAGLQSSQPRSQQEISDRIHEAIARGDQGDEIFEYMRQAKFIPLALRHVYEDCDEFSEPESCKTINEQAKRFLGVFERHVRRTNGAATTRTIARYRAWKWLLGHRDADQFMVSECAVTGHFHLNPTEVYKRLMDQVLTGAWDQMTKERTNDNDEELQIAEQQRSARRRDTERTPDTQQVSSTEGAASFAW
jgi:Fe-S cluster biosynthesis and repair protein YggX